MAAGVWVLQDRDRDIKLHSEAFFTCRINSSAHMKLAHVPEAGEAHTNKPGLWHGAWGQGKRHDHMEENYLWPLLYSTSDMDIDFEQSKCKALGF